MGDQVQQLGYFGLEIHGLFGHGMSVSKKNENSAGRRL